MDIKLRANYKNSERFMSVVNFLSKYYYELINGVKLQLNKDTLYEFNEIEQKTINDFISNSNKKKIPYQLVLNEIEKKVFQYYQSKSNFSLNSTKGLDNLHKWRNNYLHQYIDSNNFSNTSFIEKVNSQLAVINLDTDSYLSKLNKIEEIINPYGGFAPKDVKAIDPKFFKKSSIFNHINLGINSFKISNFKEAVDNLQTALDILNKEKEIENLHLYFYSWILHQFGNIYYVIGDLDRAQTSFNNSFSIKNKIEEIPKTFLFSTQLKILGIRSVKSYENTDWDKHLENFIEKVRTTQLTKDSHNELYINNLINDANYYMFSGYCVLNNSEEANKYFELTINGATKNNDKAGLIRMYYVKSIFNNTKRYSNHISDILESLNNEERNDPYVTTLFKKSRNKEKDVKKASYKHLKSLFIDHSINIQE